MMEEMMIFNLYYIYHLYFNLMSVMSTLISTVGKDLKLATGVLY